MLITWDRDLELAGPSAHYQSLCPVLPCIFPVLSPGKPWFIGL